MPRLTCDLQILCKYVKFDVQWVWHENNSSGVAVDSHIVVVVAFLSPFYASKFAVSGFLIDKITNAHWSRIRGVSFTIVFTSAFTPFAWRKKFLTFGSTQLISSQSNYTLRKSILLYITGKRAIIHADTNTHGENYTTFVVFPHPLEGWNWECLNID